MNIQEKIRTVPSPELHRGDAAVSENANSQGELNPRWVFPGRRRTSIDRRVSPRWTLRKMWRL